MKLFVGFTIFFLVVVGGGILYVNSPAFSPANTNTQGLPSPNEETLKKEDANIDNTNSKDTVLPKNPSGAKNNTPSKPGVDSLTTLPTSSQNQTAEPRIVKERTIVLAPNQIGNTTFDIGSTDGFVVHILTLAGSASFTLINPTGQTINFATLPSHSGEFSKDELGDHFALRNPTPGQWTLRGAAGGAGSTFGMQASENSSLELKGRVVQYPIRRGGSARLLAKLSPFVGSVTSPNIQVSIQTEAGAEVATAKLFDDGNHDDGPSGDGVFGGVTPVFNTAGRYRISFTGSGTYLKHPFSREAEDLLDVLDTTSLFTGSFSDFASDSDEDGKQDSITLRVGITAPAAGKYYVIGDLTDVKEYRLSQGTGLITADKAGAYTVDLIFDMQNVDCSRYGSSFTARAIELRAASLQTLDAWTNPVNTKIYNGTSLGCSAGSVSPQKPTP